jgi:hypothetical protein
MLYYASDRRAPEGNIHKLLNDEKEVSPALPGLILFML